VVVPALRPIGKFSHNNLKALVTKTLRLGVFTVDDITINGTDNLAIPPLRPTIVAVLVETVSGAGTVSNHNIVHESSLVGGDHRTFLISPTRVISA
jgi:hypothetical protein